jgi:hypothetical protein
MMAGLSFLRKENFIFVRSAKIWPKKYFSLKSASSFYQQLKLASTRSSAAPASPLLQASITKIHAPHAALLLLR